jgi:carboxyl-terminal processing protease
MRKSLLIAASAFVLGAGTMAYVGQAARATTEPKADTYHMLELFGDVLDQVDRQYVSQVDDKKLIQSAMQGMLSSLDPHSDYLTPKPTATCRTRPAANTAASAWRSPAKTAWSR